MNNTFHKKIVPHNNKRKKVSILDLYTKARYNGTADMKPKFNRTKKKSNGLSTGWNNNNNNKQQ